MSIKIKFLGACGTVTGSKYLLQYNNKNILIDCGIFQGDRNWRDKNWEQANIDLSSIDLALLTHAHIDHIGMLPRYVKNGLHCPVYCSKVTQELAPILLYDLAAIEEQDADYRAQRGKSRYHPPLPFFTELDVSETLPLLKSVRMNKRIHLVDDIYATWSPMGHIMGACAINLELGSKTITFSGDIGRYHVPILVDPQAIKLGQYLFIESTYGDRIHPEENPKNEIARIINETYDRKGVVLIPSFAVGRAQLLLYYIRELKEENLIPDIPVILDSPMAVKATKIYNDHPDSFDEEAMDIAKEGERPFHPTKLGLISDSQASKQLNYINDPMIIIAGSGMLSGGRIMHHLMHKIGNPRNTVLFVGFQPPGSKGALLQAGAKTIRIFSDDHPVHAKIETIAGLSAHGDQNELLRWCQESLDLSDENKNPNKIFIVHGEEQSRKVFAKKLSESFSWDCYLPVYLEEAELS